MLFFWPSSEQFRVQARVERQHEAALLTKGPGEKRLPVEYGPRLPQVSTPQKPSFKFCFQTKNSFLKGSRLGLFFFGANFSKETEAMRQVQQRRNFSEDSEAEISVVETSIGPDLSQEPKGGFGDKVGLLESCCFFLELFNWPYFYSGPSSFLMFIVCLLFWGFT